MITTVSTPTPVYAFSTIENSGGSGSWDTDLGVDGGNNLDTDPVLVPGRFLLQASSPVFDAGNSAALPPDILDLDGDGDIAELVIQWLDGQRSGGVPGRGNMGAIAGQSHS